MCSCTTDTYDTYIIIVYASQLFGVVAVTVVAEVYKPTVTRSGVMLRATASMCLQLVNKRVIPLKRRVLRCCCVVLLLLQALPA
jgi:hypothetical protein